MFTSRSVLLEREPGTLVTLRFIAQPTDAEYEAYLDAYADFLREEERYGLLLVAEHGMRTPPLSQLRMQSSWIETHEETLGRLCAGLAFVLPSAVTRGATRAFLRISKMPMPYTVLRTESEGRAWVRGRLRTATDHASGPDRLFPN